MSWSTSRDVMGCGVYASNGKGVRCVVEKDLRDPGTRHYR